MSFKSNLISNAVVFLNNNTKQLLQEYTNVINT